MNQTPQDLTAAVLAVMQRTPDARLREIMTSLVAHLHGFVHDVRLSEDEFRAATALLARLGQQTTDTHNEVVLMAGSLGVSSLVCLLNNPAPPSAGERERDGDGDGNGNDASGTSHNLLGPFWRMGSPRTANGASIVRSPTPGPRLWVRAQLIDQQGAPVADAEVDVWHCSPTGLYENQTQARAEGQIDMNLRGKFSTDAQGRFSFRSVKPMGYPVPTDGVVGQMLAAQGRHPMRPAHVHVLVFKEGFKTLISQVYADDDAHIDTDVQFGVTRALTGRFVRHDTPAPGQPALAPPWYSLDFSFRMVPGVAKLPRPPIK